MAKLKQEYFKLIEDFIVDYKNEHGNSPSFSQMVKELQIPKTTLHRYMQILREREIIDYDGFRNIQTWDELHNGTATEIAHEGEGISCGMPAETDGRFTNSVRLPSALFGKGPFFILTAEGNSMIDVGINPGDKLLLKYQNVADDGDIVACYVPDQDGITLKTLYRDIKHKKVILHPENAELSDQVYDEVVIQGVLTYVFKSAPSLKVTRPDFNDIDFNS